MSKRKKTLRLERKHDALLPFSQFVLRFLYYAWIALGIIVVALMIGISGYHWIAGLRWIDALLNASMILSGMGPVNVLQSDGAKLFASLYALFSGLILIVTMGVIISPLIHRILHLFHIEENDVD